MALAIPRTTAQFTGFPTKIHPFQRRDEVRICELPPNPFWRIQPGNPSSWYGEISNFMGGLLRARACVEGDITNGILGDPSHNPQASIHKMFQISALLGRMYDLLKYAIQMEEENKKAIKATHELAKAA